MKHADRETLAALEPMLRQLRKNSMLVERTPGSFYRKSKAYLHFHEDASGTYVDVKLNGEDFTRMRVTTSQEQARFLSLIAENCGYSESPPNDRGRPVADLSDVS